MASQQTLDSFATSTLPIDTAAILSGSESFEFEIRTDNVMQRTDDSMNITIQGSRDSGWSANKHCLND